MVVKMNDEEKTIKIRDKSIKRKSIIDAAIQVFLDEGFEKASMDRISEVAIASKRTVYNHFSGKQDLFQAVLEQFEQEMSSLKNIHYDKNKPIEEQLEEFVDCEISVVKNQKSMGLIKLLLTVFIRHPEIAQASMAKYATAENGLTTWMHSAIQDGKLSANDHVLASRVFSSMLGGAFTWPAVYQGEFLDHMTVELKREIIATFLARYGTDEGYSRGRKGNERKI